MSLPEQQMICTRPFEWFEVHPDGSVFLCCPAWLKRPIGNLLTQPVEDIWNGPVAREIRKSILNGSFHNCRRSRCPYLTEQMPPVCRIGKIADEQLKSEIKAKKSLLNRHPSQLNLCFDHSCNLACPSCRKQKLQAQAGDLQRAEQISAILTEQLIPHARQITLSGFGDPFGSPTYLSLLKQLNRCNYPQLQQLRLHTNGQLLTEQLWQNMPELQPLVSEIEISIDAATEQTYRLNRPGGDFMQLLRNLAFLNLTGCKLTLSMVVQQNNWREIPLLLKLCQEHNATLYLSQLVNWGTFCREEFKQRAIHLPKHTEHSEFMALLQEISALDRVKLGNLLFIEPAV